MHAQIDSAEVALPPPEIVAFAVHGKQLVQVPRVARLGAATEVIGMSLSKLPAPIPNGFIVQDDAGGSHEFFDVSVTEPEAEIQLDAVADNLRGKRMLLIWVSHRCRI